MSAAGATQYLLGYNAGDEPNMCDASQIPEISALEGFDPTRPVLLNTTRWFFGWNCNLAQATSLWTSISINSFDEYTTVDQNLALVPQIQTLFTKSDFRSASNDLLFLRGLLVQSARAIQKPGAPLWVFGEAGGDAWVSPYNTMVDQTGNGAAVLSVGSTKIVNNTGFSKFTDSWVGMGLQGQGIPPGTTLAAVGATVAFGVDGCTHATCTEATMSAAATTSNSAATVSVVGGNLARGDGVGAPGRDCVDRLNLCLVSGQEYRTWPSEVNALAWMSIINGATGIEWFCHDFWSASFCLSDISSYNVQAFGLGPDKARSEQAAANAAASNLAYVNKSILQFAPIINSPTIGYCSMDSVIDPANYLIATSSGCTGGVLTMSEHAGYAVPGNALVKTYAGAVYLIAQSTRRGPGAYDFNLLGQAGKVATVVYDSNTRYDPAYSALGKTFPLTGGGSFTDTLGLGRNPTWGDPTDGYQTKIYRIQ
jgi:hypothetical protein